MWLHYGSLEMLEQFEVCYHGTVDIKGLIIRNNGIDLSVPFPGSDFGQGFYLTNNRNQVDEWARAKAEDANDRNSGFTARPVVLRYEINLEKMKQLDGRIFSAPTLEWSQFIIENRVQSKPYYELGYDFAIGPVADGLMRSLMTLYRKKKITDTEFMDKIKPLGQMKTYTQLSVHSLKAVKCLTLKEVEYLEEVQRF